MEEKSMYDKQYEIVISFNKIMDNLVKYWWICIACFGVSLIAVLFLSYSGYKDGKELLQDEMNIYKDDIEKITDDNEDQLVYTYTAKSTVYMARDNVDLSKFNSNVFIPDGAYLEERSDYVEIYKEYMTAWLESTYLSTDKNLLYDCLALMYTDSVLDEINMNLKKAGYDEYDKNYETISMSLGNNARFYTLSLTGEDSERIKFIIDTATEILIKNTKDILGIEYSKIVDPAESKEYIKWGDQHLLATDKVVKEKEEELSISIENRMKAYDDSVKKLDDYKFSFSHIFVSKNILVLFVGVFLGLGIIFVLILLDKKIRSRDEAEMYFEYPILGDINSKIEDDTQYSVLASIIERKCQNEEIHSVLITGSENDGRIKSFTDKIATEIKKMGKACTLMELNPDDSNIEAKIEAAKKKNGLLIICAQDINKSSAAIQAAGYVDSIIFAICTNNESITMIQKGLSSIKFAGGNIMGNLLIKNNKIFKS